MNDPIEPSKENSVTAIHGLQLAIGDIKDAIAFLLACRRRLPTNAAIVKDRKRRKKTKEGVSPLPRNTRRSRV